MPRSMRPDLAVAPKCFKQCGCACVRVRVSVRVREHSSFIILQRSPKNNNSTLTYRLHKKGAVLGEEREYKLKPHHTTLRDMSQSTDKNHD